MKRTLSLAVALLMAGGLSAPAFAQAQPEVTISSEMTTQDIDMAELTAFGQVAVAHRKMARRLAANPRLADEMSFLKKYPDLNNFFTKYPGSKERFLADPGNYLADVHGTPRKAPMHHHAKAKKETKAAETTPAAPAAPPAGGGASNP